MKLSVHLVTWNGEKYIPFLFASLKKQTFTDWQLVILDNASSDGTVDAIKRELVHGDKGNWQLVIDNCPVPVTLIENKENKGFAGGHNFLNTECRTQNVEYILLLNQDMYLTEDCFEKTIQFLDKNQDVAAVSPRLMRWNFNELPVTVRQVHGLNLPKTSYQLQDSFTNKIDSLGLKVYKNRRVVELHTAEEWSEELINQLTNKQSLETFGVSGAFPMYRRSVLNDIIFSNGDFLDSFYQSYKEDVDLAYRLQSAGYKAFVLLDTIAYHDRSGAGPKEMGDRAAIKNKKEQSKWITYHSYKNHLMTIYKNEYWQNFLLDSPWILWYELKKFVYFLLFDRAVLKGLGEVRKNRKDIRNRKLEIKEKRNVGWREMRKWWR